MSLENWSWESITVFIFIKQEWKVTEVTIKPDLERGSLHPREALCQIPFYSLKSSSQHFKWCWNLFLLGRLKT